MQQTPARSAPGRRFFAQRYNAFALPAQCIQNNKWFANYAVWIREDGRQKIPTWTFKDGRFVSDYGVDTASRLSWKASEHARPLGEERA